MRAFLALGFMLFAACDGPCLQLANRICDCEMDINVQASCRNQVSLDAANVNPIITKEDNAFCTEKLKTCTCNELLKGNRQSCGFQKETLPVQDAATSTAK